MHEHAVLQRGLEQHEGLFLVERERWRMRERRDALALGDASLAQRQRLAGGHSVDAGEDRALARGELQLQQLGRDLRRDAARDEAGFQDRLRLGGEEDAARTLGVVERLDAERIARRGRARRLAGSASAMAYMPRNGLAKSPPWAA